MEAQLSVRDQSLYERNILALRRHRPDILMELAGAKDRGWTRDDFEFEFVRGRRGDPSLRIRLKDQDRSLHVHSLIDPRAEAERFLGDFQFKERSRVILCGLGCGYHLEALLERSEKENSIVAIEPNVALFEELLYHRDLTDLFGKRRYILVFGMDEQYVGNRLAHGISPLHVPKHDTFTLPYFRHYKGAEETMTKAVKGLTTFLRYSFNTGLHLGKNFFNNIAVNFEIVMNNPGVDFLKDKFAGKPGFVVAPGPSLEKNVELLREIKGKALIISLDSTVKPLLRRNIVPDLVITLDYSRRNYDKLIDVELPDTVMVAAVEVYPMIPRTHKGKMFAYYHSATTEGVYDPILGKKGHLMAGGSVLHDGFGLAVYLGCDPIVLMGVDLGFPTDRYYLEGGFDNGSLNDTVVNGKDTNLVEIEDIHGKPMKSWVTFKIYLDWMNLVVPGVKAKVIDATEGGAKIKGTEIRTLRETIDEYVKRDAEDPYQVLLGIHKRWERPSRKKIVRRIDKFLTRYKEMETLSREGLSITAEVIQKVETLPKDKLVKLLRKIKKQDRKIAKAGEYLDFMMSALYAQMFHILNYDDSRSENLEKTEWIVEVIRMSNAFYKELGESSGALVKFFEKIIKKLNRLGKDYQLLEEADVPEAPLPGVAEPTEEAPV